MRLVTSPRGNLRVILVLSHERDVFAGASFGASFLGVLPTWQYRLLD